MGHAVGEAAPAWAFNLTVTANGDCELTWQGYQKNDDILCKASGNTNGLTIYYAGSADGGAGGPAAPLFYRRNEKLMRLEVIKGSAKNLTKWAALNKAGVLTDGVRFGHE